MEARSRIRAPSEKHMAGQVRGLILAELSQKDPKEAELRTHQQFC
jgi:hypothetical protein